MPGHLLFSVSGVRAENLPEAQRFVADLRAREVPVSLLVAPRRKNGYRLQNDSATCEWLRAQRAGGSAIVLHGYDQAATKKRRAEFAAIDRHEAGLRLTAADRVLEEAGLRTRIFAAPRWSASAGALAALPDAGFRLNLGFNSYTVLPHGPETRARVLGVGDGFLTEAWWCRMLVVNTGRVARRGGTIRFAIAAKHLADPLLRRTAIDCVDLALMHGAHPQTYRDVLRPAPRAVTA